MPPTHTITYGRYLEKHQNIGKTIGTPILDTDKIMQFVVQMYDIKYFTEEHMMAYKFHTNDKKYDWHKTIK